MHQMMMGRMISFYCNDAGSIAHLACALITTTETPDNATTTSDMTTTTTDMKTTTTTDIKTTTATPDDTDDSVDDSGNGVVAQSVMVAVVASLFAMLF